MISGEKIALRAMKKELKRLSGVAEKAKAKVDENMGIGTEVLAIHNEFVEIVDSKEHGQHVLNKLEALQKRRDRVKRILKQDLGQLINKQVDAELERDSLAQEIQMIEFRHGLKAKVS